MELRDVFLFEEKREEKIYRRTNDTSDLQSRLKIVTPIYKINKKWTKRQVKRIIKYIQDVYGNRKYLELFHTISFRINKNDKETYTESMIRFLLDIILVAPLVEQGIEKMDISYFPFYGKKKEYDNKWKWSEVSKIINSYCSEMYTNKHRNLFTREEANEAICFVRECGDRIADELGPYLMQNLSLNDFIDFMIKEPKAKEIINVEYPVPKKIPNPRFVENLAKEKQEELNKIIDKHPGSAMHTIRSFGSPGQFKEMAVLMGNKPDLYGSTIPITSLTNNIKGFRDPVAVVVDAAGGLKAEVIKLKVSDAGTFERSLITLTNKVKDVDLEYVCDSKHYLKITVDKIETINELDGRWYLFNKDDSKEPFKIIKKNDKSIMNKTIYVKTPMTCTHPKYDEGIICRGCYSEALALITEPLHVGSNSSYTSADNTQQISLSAKHNLITNSHDVLFSEDFYDYFMIDGVGIYLLTNIVNDIAETISSKDNIYLEFYVNTLEKKKGKNKSKIKTRLVPEIILHNPEFDDEILITNLSQCKIHMSDRIEQMYKRKMNASNDETVKITFKEIYDDMEKNKENYPIFVIDYKNNDLTEPIDRIASILGTDKMKKFSSEYDIPNEPAGYQRALEEVAPLFKQAGIEIRSIHLEIILSRLIKSGEKTGTVDWNKANPQFNMVGYRTAIKYSESAVESMIYEKLPEHLDGRTGIFERSGSSMFDQLVK